MVPEGDFSLIVGDQFKKRTFGVDSTAPGRGEGGCFLA